MQPREHERYLQRRQPDPAPSLLDWLFCCSARPAAHRTTLPRTPALPNKRPLKLRTARHPPSSTDSKENVRTVGEGSGTERAAETNNAARTTRLSFLAEENCVVPAGEKERLRRTCKVRFSYAEPPRRPSALQLPLAKQPAPSQPPAAMGAK